MYHPYSDDNEKFLQGCNLFGGLVCHTNIYVHKYCLICMRSKSNQQDWYTWPNSCCLLLHSDNGLFQYEWSLAAEKSTAALAASESRLDMCPSN